MNYSNLSKWTREPHYEPKPRLCGGVYGYVYHRFPIKNGISWREVAFRSNENKLVKLVKISGDA